jgi:subtilase family serine protease
VSVGDVTLQPGVANRIPAGSNVTFNVKFANQGENPEADVRVRVIVRGGGKTIVAQKTVDQTTPGNETTVAVALGQPPPLGPGVNITVEVRKVPGEANVANNSQQYPAIFAR